MAKTPEYAKGKWKEKTIRGFKTKWKKNALAGNDKYIEGVARFLGIDPSHVRDEAERRARGIEAVKPEEVVSKFDAEKWFNNLREGFLAD